MRDQARAIARMSLEDSARLGNTPAAGTRQKKVAVSAVAPEAPVQEFSIEVLQELPSHVLSRAERKSAKKQAAAAAIAAKQKNVSYEDSSSDEDVEYEIPAVLMPGSGKKNTRGNSGSSSNSSSRAQNTKNDSSSKTPLSPSTGAKNAKTVASPPQTYEQAPGSRHDSNLAAKQQSEMRSELVRSDLARLAIIRQQREEAARRREAERLEAERKK